MFLLFERRDAGEKAEIAVAVGFAEILLEDFIAQP